MTMPKTRKPILPSTIEVVREDWAKYGPRGSDHSEGSGYCLKQWTKQKLVKKYRIFGLVFWTEVLDVEDVPEFAVIEKAAFGETRWKSKFTEHIK